VFSLPAGLHHRVKALADRHGQSMAALVRETLEEALDAWGPLRLGEGRLAYLAVEDKPREVDEMKRLVISLPEGLLQRVRAQGQISGISMGAYIRGILEERTRRERPKPRFGAFESGYTDTGRLAGEFRYEPRSWR
jgi:plasmid stability protein